jgi:hypothetical protein
MDTTSGSTISTEPTLPILFRAPIRHGGSISISIFTRGSMIRFSLVADTSLSGARLVHELDAVSAERSRPAMCVPDNGTNSQHGYPPLPHRKLQRRLRDELLKETLFPSLAHGSPGLV